MYVQLKLTPEASVSVFTAPSISFTGSRGYGVEERVEITCTATDPAPGSGLASATCPGVSAEAATLPAGLNRLEATATDVAGNTTTAATEFTISVRADGLCTLARRYVTRGGIANSMCQQLQAYQRAQSRGDWNAAAGSLAAFVNHVEAQSGKARSASDAAPLIRLAAAL
jgi:hypothetical protein